MEEWIQQFVGELEQLGEEEVRVRLAHKTFFGVAKEEVAREWLQQRELVRIAEGERRRAEIEAVRAAKAGDRTARVADKTNARASIAIMIAVTALIISVLSLLAQFLR
jgi:hypothetical protein